MKPSLYNEIFLSDKRYIFYKNKKFFIKKMIKNIDNLYNKIIKNKVGTVSISSKNKIDFITQFYALNRAGFPVLLNNTNLVNKIKKENLKINYFFKNGNLKKINNKLNKNYKYNIIIKTSGSTTDNRYVFLKNNNVSFISKNMNSAMNLFNKSFYELIHAPLDHAFAFGRLHSLLSSNNYFAISNEINISNFFDILQLKKKINAISINAKILSTIINLDFKLFKRITKNIKYIQISSGFFPLNLRRKLLSLGINLYINYGMTEAMRSTFLDCSKYKNKIATEGKPFKGIKIKIKKINNNKIGEILIKGRNLAYSYSNRKIWNKRIHDGYFKSGDIGYLDEDNFLIFKGRDNDRIDIKGNIFYASNLEAKLKKEFNLKNVKIYNKTNFKNDNKVYLFLEKKLKKKEIYIFFQNEDINLSFEKIIFTKFNFNETGKLNVNNLIKLINEKKDKY